jgi:methylenetetrahydrofolate dehydrogenase (NADP+) / methenyltetrahydrofolate cyclohydrolase
MAARIIDGKAVADRRRGALAEKLRGLRSKGIHPCLAAVTVSDDPAWQVYLKNQASACAAVGIRHHIVALGDGASQEDLSERIEALNVDPNVHGIIIQNPLPNELDDLQAKAQLSPDKDVEGVGPANLGLVLAGKPIWAPCTAVAALTLAREALPELRGVETVVVGASTIVGKPIAALLLAAGATVTTCHVDTRDVKAHTKNADLLVVAVGKSGLITADMVKPGAVVIDVGINRVAGSGGKTETVGDVSAEVAQVASALTPVPGGVGALTTTILLEATVAAAERLAHGRPAIDGAALSRILGGVDLSPDTADRLATLLARHLVQTSSGTELRSAFERRLARGVLVLDGAMGTELMAAGIAADRIAMANIDHPDLVQRVHRAYADAGAEALTTNTFTVNRYRCRGNRELAVRLSQAGVRLAREIARGKHFVLGSIGPLGPVVGAEIAVGEAEDAFAEIALAMADAGVDAFFIETMPSTVEAAAALAGVRRVCRQPAMVSRSIDRDDPVELAEFARACEAGGAVAIGVNCAIGPRAMLPVVARLAKLTSLPVSARPNAGFPTRADGRAQFHLRPEYLAEQASAYIAAGAGIIGGCCGVGPAHIHALVERFAHQPVTTRHKREAAVAAKPAEPKQRHPLLQQAIDRRFPIIALMPGRLSPIASSSALDRLAHLGADAIGILAGWPGTHGGARLPARLRHLQDTCGRPAVLELVAANLTLAAAQEMLITAHLIGIDVLLVDSGVFAAETRPDLPSPGCDPADLVALVRRMNSGRDLAGGHLEEATAFTVGVRIAIDRVGQMARYIQEGADFVTLQPVYEPARFRDLMASIAVEVPIFADILLLPDLATAEEIDNELPMLSVPDKLKRRLADNPDEDVRGVLKFLAHWRQRLAGVCLLMPDERTRVAELVLKSIRQAEPSKGRQG